MRRTLLALVAIAGLGLAPALATDPTPPARSEHLDPPRTGFEERNAESWTTHDEELAFLAAVDARSRFAKVEVIGTTEQGRPIHLVTLGAPDPRVAAQARREPVELHICTQHGNEPAGREACLMALRDLAFTDADETRMLLERLTVLFVPTANPDGREANSRGNSEGVDVNRDHLNLGSLEAQAIARVIRDWQPDIAIDHHEYGPGTPVLYDDEVLYLWPRNLNVDDQVHDLGVEFSKNVLAPCLADAGYTSDEYGIDAVGSTDVQQSAGGGDEGILRNAAGLRHTVGILIESAVTMNVTNGPDEVTTAGQQRRRVASQYETIRCTLEYMEQNAVAVAAATSGAAVRKTEEGRARSAKVYFAGQDDDTTLAQNGDEEVAVDPPCGYDLTAGQLAEVRPVLDLHGIRGLAVGGRTRVPMAQPAEPVIPLLLDARNEDRAATDATPLDNCGRASAQPTASPSAQARPGPVHRDPQNRLPSTGAPGLLALAAGLAALGAAATRRAAR